MAPVAAVAVVTIDFTVPVVVSGDIDLNLDRAQPAPPALLGQVVVSPTQVKQTYAATVVGCDWSFDGSGADVRPVMGGSVAAASGTF
jgi:hypothetical protein